LWLYLTRLLVQKHGRSIAISSKTNKGTTCSITFQK
jgi:signal transduction histidine kinase